MTSQYRISKLLNRFQIHHANIYYHAKFQSQGWLNTDFMKGVESTPHTCQIFKTPYHIGLTNLEKNVDSKVTKPKRGRKKKVDTKINELEDNDIRDKRERLVACVLSGNSKMYLGRENTEQQINEMDFNNVSMLINRYESVLSAQMTRSLGKSIINLYSNVAYSVLGIDNQQDLSDDLECDPFLNTALQRFTCDLYYCFGALLAPVSVGIITGKHYAKNSITKLNDRSNNGTCDTATRNCNQTEEPSEN